jgi:hypothetical protein
MKKKMKRYNGEEESLVFETKQGRNASIDKLEGIREKAMRAVAEGGQKDAAPIVKKTVKSTVTKLPMPDYSNEDLDRMGMNNDLKPVKSSVYSPKSQPESDREEYSPFMREFRKDEATAKASTKAVPELVRKAYVDAARMVKPKGMKSGGKVSSASKRADGCCIRGKTRA